MLRFAEEIILLLLRDNGRFAHVQKWSLERALAGSVLMDLALENRIDADLDKLILISDEPLNDTLLDGTLAEIASCEHERDTRYWIEQTAKRASYIHEEALNRLVSNKILELQQDRFLLLFHADRYKSVDNAKERNVSSIKRRILDVLFSDDIPTPRDVVLISLVDACGIFVEILSKRELQNVSGRIAQIRKLDLISGSMSQLIQDMRRWVAIYKVENHLF